MAGSPLSLWSRGYNETDRSRGFVRGFNFQFVPRRGGRHRGGGRRRPKGCCPGATAAATCCRNLVGHRMHVGICTEDLPEEPTRVTLDPVLTDRARHPRAAHRVPDWREHQPHGGLRDRAQPRWGVRQPHPCRPPAVSAAGICWGRLGWGMIRRDRW